MARSNTGNTANYMTNAGTPITTVPVTLACWMNLANTTHTASGLCIVDNNTGANYAAIGLDGGTDYSASDVAFVDNGAGAFAVSSATFSANTWHHVAGVCSASNNRVAYLDGSAGTASTSTRTPSGWNRLSVGAFRIDAGTFGPLNGRIAEAALWNVALTANEIAMLALGVLPLYIRPDALVCYWPLYGLDSPERDYAPPIATATRYPLTISGTMAAANHAPVLPWSSRFARATRPLIGVGGGGGGATRPRSLLTLGVGA